MPLPSTLFLPLLSLMWLGLVSAGVVTGSFHGSAQAEVALYGPVHTLPRYLQGVSMEVEDGGSEWYDNCVQYSSSSGQGRGAAAGGAGVGSPPLWWCPTPGAPQAGQEGKESSRAWPSLPPLPTPTVQCIAVSIPPLFEDAPSPSILYYCGEGQEEVPSTPAPTSTSMATTSPHGTGRPTANSTGGGGNATGEPGVSTSPAAPSVLARPLVFNWSRVYFVTVTISVTIGPLFHGPGARGVLSSSRGKEMVQDLRERVANITGLPPLAVVLRRVTWPDGQLSLFPLLDPVNGYGQREAGREGEEQEEDGQLDKTLAADTADASATPMPSTAPSNGTVRFRLRLLTSELGGCGQGGSTSSTVSAGTCVNRTLDVLVKLQGGGLRAGSAATGAEMLYPWLSKHSSFFGRAADNGSTPYDAWLLEGQSVRGYGPGWAPVDVPAASPGPQQGGAGSGTSQAGLKQGGIILAIVVGSVLAVAAVLVGLSAGARRVLKARGEAERERRGRRPSVQGGRHTLQQEQQGQGPRKRLSQINRPKARTGTGRVPTKHPLPHAASILLLVPPHAATAPPVPAPRPVEDAVPAPTPALCCAPSLSLPAGPLLAFHGWHAQDERGVPQLQREEVPAARVELKPSWGRRMRDSVNGLWSGWTGHTSGSSCASIPPCPVPVPIPTQASARRQGGFSMQSPIAIAVRACGASQGEERQEEAGEQQAACMLRRQSSSASTTTTVASCLPSLGGRQWLSPPGSAARGAGAVQGHRRVASAGEGLPTWSQGPDCGGPTPASPSYPPTTGGVPHPPWPTWRRPHLTLQLGLEGSGSAAGGPQVQEGQQEEQQEEQEEGQVYPALPTVHEHSSSRSSRSRSSEGSRGGVGEEEEEEGRYSTLLQTFIASLPDRARAALVLAGSLRHGGGPGTLLLLRPPEGALSSIPEGSTGREE